MPFLETPRFPESISYGSNGGPKYQTTLIQTGSGHEKRNANWSTPLHAYNAVNGVKDMDDLNDLLSFFHVVKGMAYGYRYKDWADYKSCSTIGITSATDQVIGTGDGATAVFQLVKVYEQGALSTSRPITKPVDGTVICAIASVEVATASVTYASGLVAFPNKTASNISNITQAASAVVTASAHTMVAGDVPYFAAVSGMVEINGVRARVTSFTTHTFTLALNTTGYTAYASGGTAATLPQSGETVTAGYEYDVPVRFDTDELSIQLDDYQLGSMSVPIMEIR